MRFLACALLAGLLVTDEAVGADALGVYVGAGVGRAEVRADPGHARISTGPGFNEHDTGWTASMGIRPILFFGAELQYFDFGHPSSTTSVYSMDVQARGPALFGVGYLPLPVPRFDLYAKVGVGRLHTAATRRGVVPVYCVLSFPDCAYAHDDVTNTRVGWGAGGLLKMSPSLAVRVEYVRFSAPTGDPDLLSLSLTWAF